MKKGECESKDIIKVNHGSIFGHNNWWTFYCPDCKAQIVRRKYNDNCMKCGCGIKWMN